MLRIRDFSGSARVWGLLGFKGNLWPMPARSDKFSTLFILLFGLIVAQSVPLHANSQKPVNSCTAALKGPATPAPSLDKETAARLQSRFGVSADEVMVSPNLKVPVIFRMDDHKSLAPMVDPNQKPIRELVKRDTVIAGGGPAGLMAALRLAKAGQKVIVLERNPTPGGLGMGSRLGGAEAAAGSAYFTNPEDGLEAEVFAELGLDREGRDRLAIPESIDGLLYKGKLYPSIWEDSTVEKLPAPFAVFKHALLYWSEHGAEDDGPVGRWADSMSMEQFVRKMPTMLSAWSLKDPKAAEILSRFRKSPEAKSSEPMQVVLDLLDLYGPSALAAKARSVSARTFISFYAAELFTRFTGTLGSGTVTARILEKLKAFPNVEIRTSTPVSSIEERGSEVIVQFTENGQLKEVVGAHVIFAAPLPIAAKVIQNFQTLDPEKAKLVSQMKMADYAVHIVRIKGHPYRGNYDTWPIRTLPQQPGIPIPYIDPEFQRSTDYILGRYVDPLINGYIGMRDFRTDPLDDYGVITIYHPLGPTDPRHFTKENLLAIIENDLRDMHQDLDPIVAERGQKIEIELVESYRWAYALHVVEPHALARAEVFARPIGRIHFANSTLADPELETSLALGAREAKAILEKSAPPALLKPAATDAPGKR